MDDRAFGPVVRKQNGSKFEIQTAPIDEAFIKESINQISIRSDGQR